MSRRVADYLSWVGVWAGVGDTQAGQQTAIRTDFVAGLDGTSLQMHFEAWDTEFKTLYHGVRAVLAPAPSGVLRALGYSTIHGPLILELTPDDEGVMALAGDSRANNHLSVTFVQDAPGELLFTAFWRSADKSAQAEDGPRMTCRLKPATPWSPPRA
ncbi:MAG: hypothetical protein KDB90_15095 [Planctomycetes bacterium]|nr:hypothetical protein [Planctomycetota bacterium]